MTLNKASKRFHISMEKLKSYEENDFLEHQTLADGTFDYTKTEIRKIGLINSLIKSGMSMETLKKYLRLLNDKTGSKEKQMGGSAINTAFFDAGLLDEVIVLIGAGIDGRASFPPVFNRTDNGDGNPTHLTLIEAKTYASGAVFIRYKTK